MLPHDVERVFLMAELGIEIQNSGNVLATQCTGGNLYCKKSKEERMLHIWLASGNTPSKGSC